MTLEEMMILVGSLVDWKFELTSEGKIPPELVAFFNACSGDIVDVARYAKRATLNYEAGVTPTEFSLPVDYYKLPEYALWYQGSPLKELNLNDHSSTGFRRWGKTIILQGLTGSGTLELYYYATLPRFVGNPNEEPVINVAFHDLYVLFAAAKFKQGQPDELEPKRDFWGEYRVRRMEFDLHMSSEDPMPYYRTVAEV